MENEIVVQTEDEVSFAPEIAKAFVISMAATAGAMTGLLLVGLVADKIKSRRNAKKVQPTQVED